MGPWPRLLTVPLLLLTAAAGRAEPPGLHLHDDFDTDTRPDYQLTGEAAWRKGALTLRDGTALGRKAAFGFSARVRADVRWAAGQTGEARIAFFGERGRALVALRLGKERAFLINHTDGLHFTMLDPLPDGAEPAWTVLFDVSHGLARGKAWRHGTPEPKAWRTVRYIGLSTWTPMRLEIQAAAGADLILTSLDVRSAAPFTFAPGQEKELRRAEELHDASVDLYNRENRTEEALARGREALALRRNNLPANHPDLAQSLSSLAPLLRAQGQLQEALAVCDEGLKIRRRILPPEHPDLSRTLLHRGAVLRDLGRPSEALSCFEEMLRIDEQVLPPGDRRLAPALSDYGRALHDLGRLDGARDHYERALALYRRDRKVDPVLFAVTLENLANLQHDLGRLDEARRLYEEALAVLRKNLPPDHPHVGRCLNNLAVLLKNQGRFEESRALLEDALAVFRKRLPEGHQLTTTSLNNLAGVYHDLGQFDKALAYYRENLALREKTLPPTHPNLAVSLNNLGVLLHQTGKTDEARRCYERAANILRRSLPPGHPQLGRALNNLGSLLAGQGQFDEAWGPLSEAATLWADYAERVSDASARRDHASFLNQGRHNLNALLSAALQAKDLSEARRREVLGCVLDVKAVSGHALAARAEAVARGKDAEATELFRRLGRVRQQSADLLLRGPGTGADYLALCKRLRDEEDELERALAARARPYAELRRTERAGPDELAARLPAGAVMIEFVFHQNHATQPDKTRIGQGQHQYSALLLWGGGCRLVPLGDAAALHQAVQTWRRRVEAGEPGDKGDALRRRLWDPLARALPADCKRLFLAPDGQLALVPLEALRLADGTYLVERYQMAYVTTGRDLLPRPRPAGAAAGALIVADPDYEAGPAAEKARGALQFQRLPGFAREADTVARLLQERPGWKVQSLRGADATEEALARARRPRLLYCATHGYFLADRPRPTDHLLRGFELTPLKPAGPRPPNVGGDFRLRGGLALAGANRGPARAAGGLSDGLLTALEVENLDLWGTELVVLSACETGLGNLEVGEGVLGLRRAFQLAGARTVLASLWQVPDDETAKLMTGFLRRWLDGGDTAAALRQAQLELIRELRGSREAARRPAPPLYWAGFITHGQTLPSK
jgi:CHAT domain-containing protein/tetratricopeptide (TPR) repeat protein